MDEKDKNTLIDFYRKNYEFYGDSIQALAWYTRETQRARFVVLTSFWDINNCSVLDVGSGLGGFWAFLKEEGFKIKYTGIDIVNDFVSYSSNKYIQEADFILKDLKDVNEKYDFVFASGTFNHKCKDNEKYIKDQINKMFEVAQKGIAFNLLSEYTPSDAKDEAMFYYYNPDKIFEYCKKLTQNIKLRHDYLPNDFTIAISKV